MPDDPVAAYLRSLNTSDRARADAWDAVYADDDATAMASLRRLPMSDQVRANLWDLRQGGTLTGTLDPPKPARTEDFTTPGPTAPEGAAAGRFAAGVWENLNPVSIAKGLWSMAPVPEALGGHGVLAPAYAAGNIALAQYEQARKAADLAAHARGMGDYVAAAGRTGAALLPILGPAAAAAGERIATGDVAGGVGEGVGLLVPTAIPTGVRAARTAAQVLPTRVAEAAERAAASRVADVISPKVGANKVRLGNQAEKVAPALARELAKEGAPFSREAFHAQVQSRRVAAEQLLDEASDARLGARTYQTQPMIDALLERRRQLTAEAVGGSRPLPAYEGRAVRGARAGEEFVASGSVTTADVPTAGRGYRSLDTGEFAGEPSRTAVPLGRDVVPGPNAARVAMIDQAIDELRKLGPVTRYDPIRTIRQAYDGAAKPVYSPAVTADYLKQQGKALGAADVTGVLREQLAQWDPQTAAANAEYSLYRTTDDVMRATAEVERTRPRVGRQIIARMTGTILGGQQAGLTGAAVGYAAGPIVESALACGATTQLKTAALLGKLADAIRRGDVGRVHSLSSQLKRVGTTAAAVVGGSTSQPVPSTTPAAATR